MLKLSTATPGLTVTNKSRLGDIAEQWVKLLSHWKGCEVFQNVGCTGKTDMVIVHPTLGTLQVDVKTSTWRPISKGSANFYWQAARASDVKRPVYAVCVVPDGDIANWRVHWRNLKKGGSPLTDPIWDCPPGWESFWDNDHRIYSTTFTKPTEHETTQAAS